MQTPALMDQSFEVRLASFLGRYTALPTLYLLSQGGSYPLMSVLLTSFRMVLMVA